MAKAAPLVVFSGLIFLHPAPSRAQTWTGADGNSSWNDPLNWSPNGVPNSSTASVIISSTTDNPVTINSGVTVGSLTLSNSTNSLTIALGQSLTFANPGGSSISNAGNILVSGGGGNNTELVVDTNTSLSGSGILTLSTASGGGSVYIQQGTGGITLTNASTIQGNGIIGNGGLTVDNSGTVNANVSGGTLYLNGGGNVTNTGLLEATGGGILQINNTVNNQNGSITANGGTVQLAGAYIVGGALNNISGTLGTPSGNSATLDGSTAAGAVTISGTYTGALSTATTLLGTINNTGNIQLNGGSGTNTELGLGASTNLQGGGTVTLSTASGGGGVYIQQNTGGLTLTNVDNTIQGNGVIGNGGLTFVNQATVNANVSGGTLYLNGGGNVTNTGLLEATGGGILQINNTVNNSGGNITAGSGSTVQLAGAYIVGGALNNISGTLGTPSGNSATLDGSTAAGAVTISGTYTGALSTTTNLLGTINNTGNIQLNGGSGTNTELGLGASTTLQGGGTVTLSAASGGGSVYIQQNSGGLTLTNVDNTIQGNGVIGNGGLTFVNQATVNANVSGGTLLLNGGGGVTNTALLEATGGGTLEINTTVNNSGGNITAGSGSTVQLVNADIQGGTLNNTSGTGTLGTPQGNSATLDGSTAAGAVTINGTYTGALNTATYTLGTINNTGNIQLNGGSGNSTELNLDASTTLQGGGTLTLSTANGGGNAIILQNSGGLALTNVDNTIQGNGVIGSGGLTLVNQASGIVDANSSTGPPLTLNGGGGVANAGLLEATGGGTLVINTTVNNSGGNITAGSGSAVQLVNADIQGGTLNNTSGSGTFETPGGTSATLDGSTQGTLTINGTYTGALNSITYVLGTINNTGNIQINGGAGNNTELNLAASTTLQGGGTVTLSTANGGGNAYILQNSGGLTLTNVDNTIQGNGIIGSGGLTFVNQASGIVDANSSTGPPLTLNGGGGVANAGLLEATGGGTLVINTTVNNSGGNITAGSGSAVQLVNADIQGGTLNNTSGSGTFETPSGNSATLDGSTQGTLTINGTYTGALNSTTYVLGTINNTGNIQLNGGAGNNTILDLTASTTLQGGGTVTLSTASGGGNAYILQNSGGLALTNVDNTIQGNGIIGSGGLTLLNESGGTVLANSPGQTLLLNGGGGVTNNGTFQADAGSTLFVDTSLTNYNPTTSTLTGGTYNAYSGTIALSQADGANGSAVIATNAANILLDGATAAFTDASGHDILRGFITTNMTVGSLTIQDGALLTTASSGFSNAGTVNIGANSTFTVGGTNDYIQTGGTTSLWAASSSLVVASGHAFDLNGGTLEGIGTLTGNLVNSGGTVLPGLPGSIGTLTITGNYSDPPSSSVLDIQISGSGASLLDVGGTASLTGTTLDVGLLNGFIPTNGQSFEILATAGGVTGMFTDPTIVDGNVTFTAVIVGKDVFLDASVSTVVPEPASIVMLGLGMLGAGAFVARKSRSMLRG